MAVPTILPHVTPSTVRLEIPHDEITDLALDLMHDEPCMQLLEARSHALDLQDELAIYAAAWDHAVFRTGNADALSR
ncbi:MAG TPA: hypothetical protein VGD69_30350 [Herpetosiphonaceae bacterium]